jgi:hypothetical protein
VGSTSGNHPGSTASSAPSPSSNAVSGSGSLTGGNAAQGSDAGNDLTRLRQDVASLSDRISALERRQSGYAGPSSAGPTSGSSMAGAAGATGSPDSSSPGGAVSGGSTPGAPSSEEIARLRQDVTALRDRITQLEQRK